MQLLPKAYVFIPARFASSRLPGKPLQLIAGQPMIQRVYERIAQASNVAGIYVATDDERIAEVVQAFGGQAVMTPAELESGTDRIAKAAQQLGLPDNSLIVNVQGDQPLIHPSSIDAVIAPFLEPDYDGSFEMSSLSYKIVEPEEIHNSQDVKLVTDLKGFALYFSRAAIPYGRDTATHDYYKHLGVYAYTKRFLEVFKNLPPSRLESIEKLEQLRVLEQGYKIKIMPSKYDSPGVDVPGDVERLEALIAAQG